MHIITDALPVLPADLVTRLIDDALSEDWQSRGDVTSQAVIPAVAKADAIIRARDVGVLAGLDLAATAFLAHESGLNVTRHKADGDALAEGDDVMSIAGPAHALLSAERVALNYLGHLSLTSSS